MKKIIALIAMIIMVFTLVACGNGMNGQNKITAQKPLVVLVTNVGPMGDSGFNDAGWAGCEKAKEENEIDIRCLETGASDELEENLQSAGNDGAALVVVMGNNNKEIIEKTAKYYPETNFLIVDGESKGDNISNVIFKEEQGAFLAGVAAASQTKTKTVGFVGGMECDAVYRYEYGYRAGVKAINENINVISTYTGTFGDEEKGSNAALTLYKEGADVIMQAAGKTGVGVIKTAAQKKIWAIGTDTDQSVLSSDYVLCSATKSITSAVSEEIKKAYKGDFKAETIEKNIKNDGVGISDNAGNLPSIINDKLDDWRKAIGKEEFVVPYNEKTLNNFEAPKI